MKIDGHYDREADIAWLRFEGYDPQQVRSQEVDFGLLETDSVTKEVVALEYWRASETLPAELLQMLPQPPVSVHG